MNLKRIHGAFALDKNSLLADCKVGLNALFCVYLLLYDLALCCLLLYPGLPKNWRLE
jgi:hypothetical protein